MKSCQRHPQKCLQMKTNSGRPKGYKVKHLLRGVGEGLLLLEMGITSTQLPWCGICFLYLLWDTEILSQEISVSVSRDYKALEAQEEQKQKRCVKMEATPEGSGGSPSTCMESTDREPDQWKRSVGRGQPPTPTPSVETLPHGYSR